MARIPDSIIVTVKLDGEAARLAAIEQALREAGEKQTQAVEAFRARGIRFATRLDKPWEDRTEAERWEAVAFSLYTDLVEIEGRARALLEGSEQR